MRSPLLRGELVCMRLFDVGSEVDLSQVPRLAGLQPHLAPFEAKSALPHATDFPGALEVIFPLRGGHETSVEVRLHALGVVSVRYRLPLQVASLAECDDKLRAVRIDGKTVDEAALALATAIRRDIAGALRNPYAARVRPEQYDVYCLHVPPGDVPDLLEEEADTIAQLISDSAGQTLVPARRAAAAKHTLQYTPGDAVVIGWDHALILDEPGEYEDVLDVMELANAELLEFRTYDDYLDLRLQGSFDSLDRLWKPWGLFRSARSALQDISQVRVEFARLTDNLHDTGKIFGDWYTAQLHQRLHERFHLASWERAVAAKMETLEDMFHLAQEEATHRRSLVLEIAIVLLFILDLVILVRLES